MAAHPRLARAGGGAVVLVVAGAAFLSVGRGAQARHPPTAPPPPAVPLVSTPSPLTTAEGPAWVRLLANPAVVLSSYARSVPGIGVCPVVPVSEEPTARIIAVLGARLRGLTVSTVGQSVDQNAGLCSVQVRGTDAAGATVVASVGAPQVHAVHTAVPERTGREQVGRVQLQYAEVTTAAGWSVVVGVVGPGRTQPRSDILARLAADPRLAW